MITTWSYSRYATYKQCPRKAKYLYVDRLKEASSEALDNGTRIHALMEEYLRVPGMPVPIEAKKFSAELEGLKKFGAKPEEMWAFDKDLKECGTWAPEVWLRGKLDAYILSSDGVHLRIIDFKTGKVRPKNMEQLDLYALMGFCKFLSLEHVTTELWYLDEGELQSEGYHVQLKPRLEQVWRARINPYFIDTRFEPNPSRLCGWCSFSKGKGGPCEF